MEERVEVVEVVEPPIAEGVKRGDVQKLRQKTVERHVRCLKQEWSLVT